MILKNLVYSTLFYPTCQKDFCFQNCYNFSMEKPTKDESKHKPNRPGPCLEKGCAWCCDPVKIGLRKRADPSVIKIPKNEKGEEIWKKKDEILVPEKHPETERVHTYDCINFDEKTGLCKDYENRPDICRGTSCIDEKSEKSIDEQHKELSETKFFKIKGKI